MGVNGYGDLLALSARLKQMGTDGQGLRRELLKGINEAARPLTEEIRAFAHLAPYMPNRYAAVLAADIEVTAVKSISSEPSVRIRARGRAHRRKVIRLNDGIITHPVFGDRQRWVDQTRGMRPGFFTDPADRAGPAVRDRVLAAMAETARKITGP